MSQSVFIKFAPVFTLERYNDPVWARPGRMMYEPGSLKFMPGENSALLLVDHDYGREIGRVHRLSRDDWLDGPWFFASATVDDPPSWLERGTPVSFGFGPVHIRDMAIRDSRAEVVAQALVEVSVLSPSKRPAEPLAQVISLRPTEPSSPPAGLSSDRHVAGVTRSRRALDRAEIQRRLDYAAELEDSGIAGAIEAEVVHLQTLELAVARGRVIKPLMAMGWSAG